MTYRMRRPDGGRTSLPPLWLHAAPWLFLLLWSSGFVFLKVGLRDADPLTFLALRYACVVVILTAIFLVIRPSMPRGGGGWRHVIVGGLLIQVGYFAFTYLSLKAGASAGAVALITSQQPILVGLLAPTLAGERVDGGRWAGLLLGVTGAVIVILSGSAVDMPSAWGLTFAGIALFSITLGALWEKRSDSAASTLSASMVQHCVGLLVIAPLAWWLEPMKVVWTPSMLGSLAYLVVGNSMVAISLLLGMIRHGEASRVSALFFLVPPATVLIAFMFLDEAIALTTWPGMLMAAAGIHWVMRKSAS